MHNVYKGFVALFNLRLPLFLGSIVMRYIPLCYLQGRCNRTQGFSEFKPISHFPPRGKLNALKQRSNFSLRMLSEFSGEKPISTYQTIPRSVRHLELLWSAL